MTDDTSARDRVGILRPTDRAALDPDLRRYMLRVYNTMAGGLAVSGGAAALAIVSGFYTSIAGTPLQWVVMLAPLAAVLFLSLRIERMAVATARATFWTYAVLMGLSLAGIFALYAATSIVRVFFIAAATFAATSLYGYVTRRDLSQVGAFLFMGLAGVILATLVNLFLASSALHFAVSVIGIFVFTGLTAYDTQRIKEIYFAGDAGATAEKKSIMGALALYLDFVNLFLTLLHLVGQRRD